MVNICMILILVLCKRTLGGFGEMTLDLEMALFGSIHWRSWGGLEPRGRQTTA